MGWEINERTLSPTYVDDPIDWWYPEPLYPDSEYDYDYFPQLGKVTGELLRALEGCYEQSIIDESVGPLPEGYFGRQVRDITNDVLREYGLSIDVYMSELERRTSPKWRYQAGLWDLDALITK